MECLEAQRIVSERLDRDEVDTALLEKAKEHCRSCDECGAFVRTLATLRMMPLPEPPAELTERIMEAVQTEKAVLAANSAVAFNEAASAPEEPVEAEPVSFDRLAEQLKDRRHRKAIIGWVAAAAVVFVVAGFGAMAGVRQILSPARSSTMATTEYGYSSGPAEEFGGAPAATQDSAAGASKSAPEVGAAPSYITVGALVYRLTGEASGVDETSLSKIGATSNSLGSHAGEHARRAGWTGPVRRLREGRRGHAVRIRASDADLQCQAVRAVGRLDHRLRHLAHASLGRGDPHESGRLATVRRGRHRLRRGHGVPTRRWRRGDRDSGGAGYRTERPGGGQSQLDLVGSGRRVARS